MEYNVPLVLDSDNKPAGFFMTYAASGRQFLIIFSDPAKWTVFTSLASKMIEKGKKFGYFKLEESSFDNVVQKLRHFDYESLTDAITFMHDSDPRCDRLLSSMADYINKKQY